MSLNDALLEQIPWGAPRARAATVSGLGAALEATRRDRLIVAAALVFALALVTTGLAGTVRVAISTFRDIGSRGDDFAMSVVQLVAIPVFFFGVAAFVVFVTRRRMRDFVGVFEHGIAVDSKGTLRLVRWQEVARFHAEVSDLVSGATRRAHDSYRVELHDGSQYSWNWEFERHREVGLCCSALLRRHLPPDRMA